jgi:predicted amidohydrolase YtcJ
MVTLRRKEDIAMNSHSVADLILRNGRVTTLDPKRPEANSLAIKDGRILSVGDAADAAGYERGPETGVIDLKGRRVTAGLNDSHIHPIRGGLNYNMELRWDGVTSLAGALEMLRKHLKIEKTRDMLWLAI